MLLTAEILTVIMSVVMPVGLALYLCFRLQDGWKWLLAGAGVYVLAGMLCYYGILAFLFSFPAFAAISSGHPYGYAFGSSALEALLLTGISWMVIRILARSDTRFLQAAAYGTGMAGMASLLLVGVSALQLFVTADPAVSWSSLLASGIERVCVLVIQISWSIWLLYAVQQKKPLWGLLALVVQWLTSACAVILHSILGFPPVASVLFLLVCAAGMGWSVRHFLS